MSLPARDSLGFCAPCNVAVRRDGVCPFCFKMRLIDWDAEPVPVPAAVPRETDRPSRAA